MTLYTMKHNVTQFNQMTSQRPKIGISQKASIHGDTKKICDHQIQILFPISHGVMPRQKSRLSRISGKIFTGNTYPSLDSLDISSKTGSYNAANLLYQRACRIVLCTSFAARFVLWRRRRFLSSNPKMRKSERPGTTRLQEGHRCSLLLARKTPSLISFSVWVR